MEPSHGQEPRGRAEKSPVEKYQLAEPLRLLGQGFATTPSGDIRPEEKVIPKEKELHSIARNKVVTNPRTRSTPRKVKDVMTQGQTQNVAWSPLCRRRKTNLKEQYTSPKVPDQQLDSPHPPPPTSQGEEGDPQGEGAPLRGPQQGSDQPKDPVHPEEGQRPDDPRGNPRRCKVPFVL